MICLKNIRILQKKTTTKKRNWSWVVRSRPSYHHWARSSQRWPQNCCRSISCIIHLWTRRSALLISLHCILNGNSSWHQPPQTKIRVPHLFFLWRNTSLSYSTLWRNRRCNILVIESRHFQTQEPWLCRRSPWPNFSIHLLRYSCFQEREIRLNSINSLMRPNALWSKARLRSTMVQRRTSPTRKKTKRKMKATCWNSKESTTPLSASQMISNRSWPSRSISKTCSNLMIVMEVKRRAKKSTGSSTRFQKLHKIFQMPMMSKILAPRIVKHQVAGQSLNHRLVWRATLTK